MLKNTVSKIKTSLGWAQLQNGDDRGNRRGTQTDIKVNYIIRIRERNKF